ncbi:MAG: outer membrane beta-barrel protein [Proteobacteria bacterium]|nr:outer membrane beta-barrel protein [Pseudomonadota bacterium]
MGSRRTAWNWAAQGGRTSPAILVICAVLNGAPAAAEPSDSALTPSAEARVEALTREVAELRALVTSLTARLDSALQTGGQSATAAASTSAPATESLAAAVTATSTASNPWQAFTVNAALDGYFEYNSNHPSERVNVLRAYDVSSDSFSLNQADLVIESAPDLSAGRRVGLRLDFQFGQATEALQGNPANELRPAVYRNVFQAYGTYVLPVVSRPLQLDFGKWASAIGIEGNYTKDQVNYSRSFWFDYLPFYHEGLRASYRVSDQLTLSYWLANGAQQTEDFNRSKDQLIGFVVQPSPSLSWTLNYYDGQEHPDVAVGASGTSGAASLQGYPLQAIANPANGHLRIVDTYATWQATEKLLVALEADAVTQRVLSSSAAQRVGGGAAYLRYQLSPAFALATRVEYLEDREALFSGAAQYLKEATLTAEYRVADGFIARGEYRRDASNLAFFPTDTAGVLRTHQDTWTLGLVWWVGQKQGPW